MTLNPTNRDGLGPVDTKFLANIEEHGWAVTMVTPRLGEEGGCFAYSTGLFLRFGQPEIVICGLDLKRMHKIINIIGKKMKGGMKFIPGTDYDDLLERYACQFKSVDKSHYREYLGWSSWFYEGKDYPTLQCFWPDRDGNYPWESECNTRVRELQPFLFETPSKNSGHVQ